eukprot:2049929-Lingulodinium_polyedra.AAC.1
MQNCKCTGLLAASNEAASSGLQRAPPFLTQAVAMNSAAMQRQRRGSSPKQPGRAARFEESVEAECTQGPRRAAT